MSIGTPIHFTDSAAQKVNQLIQEEGNSALKLRVFITGGGCSGFQYGFTFDESINHDDMVIEKMLTDAGREYELVFILQGFDLFNKQQQRFLGLLLLSIIAHAKKESENGKVQLLVDPMSLQYLMGAEIDYREDINGAQFVIRNPNAKTTCGCGSSFAA